MITASNTKAFALGAVTTFALLFPALGGQDREPAQAITAPAAQPAIEGVDHVLRRKGNGHFYVDAMVNGQLIHFIVDTGASGVVLSEKDAAHIGLQFSPNEYEVVGRGVSGPARGKRIVLDSVAIGNKEVFGVEGAIIEGSDMSLLGQSYLSRIGLVKITGDEMVLR